MKHNMDKKKTNNNSGSVEVLSFEKCNIPAPYENINTPEDRYVAYGYNNAYPDYLLSLYNGSPIHAAIVNGKATYITGDGLKYDNGTAVKVKVNPADGFDEFIDKCVKDYLLYNYFAVEVTYNSFNEPIEYHWIPANRVRTNKSKTLFWYCEDWVFKSNTVIKYEAFRQNNNDSNSKIFFFDGYYPSLSYVYPSPEYKACIKSISTDIAIRDFNLNNIKNHFSVSTLITFFNGSNIAEDVKKDIIKDIKNSYSGENGNKVIVDFQNTNGKSADVQNISPNDWDKAYTAVSASVSDDIYRGHQVTSPMLFGVKTEGQLGGATELETAYEIFKNTYIRSKRAELVGAFNSLFTGSKIISGSLSFTDKALFSTQLSDNLKQQVYTINELRKEAGLPAIPNGDRLLNEPVQETTVQPVDKGELHQLSEEDFDKVKHLGASKDGYTVVSKGKYVFSAIEAMAFDMQADISNWILSHDITDMSMQDIIQQMGEDGIKATVSDLKGVLSDMSDAGIISSSGDDGSITIKPNKQSDVPDTNKVQVLYDYVKRDGVSGDILLPTSRGFCKALVNNNKYYSREDIQSMSQLFGYDIFQYCGGFYYNPSTNETTPYCRHKFQSVIVTPKS